MCGATVYVISSLLCDLVPRWEKQLLPHFSYTQNTRLDLLPAPPPPPKAYLYMDNFVVSRLLVFYLIPKNPSPPSGSKIRGAPKKCENKPHE